MKLATKCACLLMLLLWALPSRAQSIADRIGLTKSPLETYRGLAFGAGATIIDGVPYYLIHVAPQLQFDRVGIGLDGNIRFTTDFHLRKEDWQDAYSYVRWLNYLSYGFQGEDIYGRIGGIEHGTIGSGVIVSNYSNQSSYDNRKIGFAGRLDLGAVGGEAITSDLFQRGFVALRPFARPFRLTPYHKTWLLKDIEVGATVALDFDSNATRIIPNHSPYVEHHILADSTDSVVVVRDSARIPAPFATYGLDISTLLWSGEKTMGKFYTDYVKFAHFNDGFIFGFRTAFYVADGVLLDLRGERSLFHNQFLPNYYNSFYERDRFDDQARPQDYVTKLTLLSDSAGGNGNGFRFGEFFNYKDRFEIQTTYAHLDNLEGKDLLETQVVFPNLLDAFYIRISYARKNIDGVRDILGLDDRSLLTGLVAIQPIKWLLASVIARVTFAKDQYGHVQTQHFFEPKADFIFSL